MVGSDTLTCEANGNWTDRRIQCEPVDCGTPPTVLYADLSSTNTDTTYGSVVNYACHHGYLMDGANNATCQSNTTWSTPPSCEIANCSTPPVVQNGITSPYVNITYNATVNYTCETGHVMTGSDVITCTVDTTNLVASWTAAPNCTIYNCGAPTVVSHSKVDVIATTYNSTANVTCHHGYNMSGSDVITCGETGWSVAPTCHIVDCGAPPIIPDGDRSFSDTVFNSTATYSCTTDSWYKLSGPVNITCGADGNWTTRPVCVNTLNDCGPYPVVKNATVIASPDVNLTTTYGAYVNYTCDVGFNMTSVNSFVKCLSNGWSTEPVCSLKSCGAFPVVSNAGRDSETDGTSTSTKTYGSSITYTCNAGYQMKVTTSPDVTCLASGQWSDLPKCRKKNCGPIPVVTRASAVTQNITTTYGSQVVYACEEGYSLVSTTSHVTCAESGNWTTPPFCQIKDCGQIPSVPLAHTSGSPVTTYGTVVNYTCDTGHELVSNWSQITCTADAQWSQSPQCRIVNCGPVPEAPHTIVIDDPFYTTYGATARYMCSTGFIQSGFDEITCQADGTWSGAGPTCIVSTTTPAPTLAPCTKLVNYYSKDPLEEKNMTMNVTETSTHTVSSIWCQSTGLAQMTVVYGCAMANKTAGFIWWDAFCVTRARRRRPPLVTGPVIVRPLYVPKEAPAAEVIGTVELAIVMAIFGFMILLDLVTVTRHLTIMRGNVQAWVANGFKRTPYPTKVKAAKPTTNFTTPNLTTISSSEPLTRQSPRVERQDFKPKIKTTFVVPPINKHIGSNTADPWKSAMAMRRTQQAFRSARSKPVDKAEAKAMNSEMVNTFKNVHVPAEYFVLPNGAKAKKVYLA